MEASVNWSKQVAALDAGLEITEPDLSIPLLRVLLTVFLKEHISVSELAESINVPQQSASRYVAILQGRYQTSGVNQSSFVRAPLLSVKPGTNDLRRYELELTNRGRSRLEDILSRIYPSEILK